MTKISVAVFGALALASASWGQTCPAGSLSTGLIAGTSVPTSTLTNWGSPNPPGIAITVPQFNPALGTLCSVTISATGTASGTATGTNNGGRAATFTITLSASVLVTGPSGTANLNPLPATSETFTAISPGNSGTISGQTGTATVTETATSGLANYIGTGTVLFGASANGTSSTTVTSGSVSTVYTTTAGASLSVSYGYLVPALSLTKTPATATVTQGNTGTFTLTVSNSNASGTGPTFASVTVTDPVPANLTVNSVTPGGSGIWNCGASSGQTVSCTTSTVLAAGSSFPGIVVGYTAASGTGSPYTNTVTSTGGGGPTPTPASATVTVPPLLTLAKTPATATVNQGNTGTFTLTVSNSANAGPTTAAVTVTDPVPANLTVNSVTPGGSGVWNCGASSGQTVTCTTSTVLAGGSSYPGIVVGYTAASGAGSPYTNTVTSTGGGGPTPTPASATVTVPPLLTLAKTPATATVNQGNTGTFTLTVSNSANAGPTTAAVTVTDPVPANLTVNSVTPGGSGVWNCGASSGQTVTCTTSTVLAGGSSYPGIVVGYTAASGAGSPYTNTVTSTGGGGPTPTPASATVTVPPLLTLTKTPATATVAVNGTGTFTLTLSNAANAGPTTAAVTVTDPVPTNLTVTSVTPGGSGIWNCGASAGQTVSCTTSTVLAPGSSYPGIVVGYTAASATGSPYTNTATATGGGGPTPPPASATVTVPAATAPALSLTKTPATATVTQGNTGTFTLTVSNASGAGPTTAPVTVTDPVPANLTVNSVAPGGSGVWNCGASSGQTVSCTTSTVLTGGSSFPGIVVGYTAASGTGSPYTNTVSATGGGGPTPTPASATVTVPPLLTLAKTPVSATVAQGNTGTFTLTVSNAASAGPTTAPVTVTDPVPANLTVNTVTPGGSGIWNCGASSGQTVSCTTSSILAPGSSYPGIVIGYTAASGTGSPYTNTVSSTGGGGPTPTPASATVSVPPLLTLTKTPATATVAVNGTGTFTLTVSNAANAGPTTAAVTVTDPVPANLTVNAVTPGGSGIWNCGASSGQTVSCTTSSILAPGSSYPGIVIGYTAASATGSPYTNTANATGGGGPTPPPASAIVTVPTPAAPALSLAKTPATATVTQGNTGTFTLTVSNAPGAGPTTAAVTVTDPVPTNLTVNSVTPRGSGVWNCGASSGQTVSCTASTILTGGSSYPGIVVGYTAASGTGSPYTNTVSSTGGGGPVPTPASATVTVPPLLTLTKTPATASVAVNGTGTFTLTISDAANAGPTTAAVTVTDPVPANLTVKSVTPGGAGVWNCGASAGQTVSCTTSTALAPGSSYPGIVVGYAVASASGSPYTNTATATGGGGPTPPPASAIVTVPPPPPSVPSLSILKTPATNTVIQNGAGTFTLTVSDAAGAGPTSGTVTVTDPVPAGLTITGAPNGNGWFCNTSGQLVTCLTTQILGPGASYSPITVPYTVASSTPAGTLTNTATETGGGDPNTHTASATVTIPPPALSITKTPATNNVAQGGSGSFTLTVSNSNAPGTGYTTAPVTVTDPMPPGLTVTGTPTGSGWNCGVSGQTVTCTITQALAPGASYPAITVSYTVGANTPPGTLTNTATETGGGDPNTHTASATVTIPASVPPSLSITKTPATNTVAQGGTGTFTLTVSNSNATGTGPTTAAITVTDPVPAGLTVTGAPSGSGWNCSASSGQSVSCTTSAVLASGASYPGITVPYTVAAGTAPGTLTNTATETGGGDPNTHTASATVAIPGLPDMTITKTHTGTSFAPGGSVTFTLTASNVGTAASSGPVTVTDTLPAGLTATAINAASPWICQPLPALSCSRSDSLAVSSAYSPITVTAGIAPNATGPLVNNAQVSGGGETNLNNDKATDSINVTGQCQPTLLKTNSGNFLPGGNGTYTMIVSNTGSAPMTGNNTVTDPMPQGLTATAITGPGWNCNLSPVATCTRSDTLAPGGRYPAITLTVAIAANAPSSIVNVATATCDCDPTPIVPIAAQSGIILAVNLSTFLITKTADQTTAQIGDVIGYTIQVVNGSNSPFTNAQVQDLAPPGFLYVPGSGQLSTGSTVQLITPVTTTPGTLIFPLGTLAAQQTDTITYRLQVGSKAHVGANTNTAQGTGTQPNGSPAGSNQAHAVVTIQEGLFTTRQFLIGRVFEDANGNGEFDDGERPVAGARVYASNGGSATTDSNGLYDIPVVAPGSIVVELDAATVPRGYTLSSGNRLDAQSWSRLVRTPLGEGMMLRQNFGLKPCPSCRAAAPVASAPGPVPVLSSRPPAKLEVIPLQPSLPGDGRTSMQVRVRVLDDQGNPTKAKEVRIRTSAGQFVKEASASGPNTPQAGTSVPPATNGPVSALLGTHTELQGGRTTEQVPQTMQAGMAKSVEGEATFLLMAANTPGEAHLVAESGDPDNLLSAETSVWFTPEKRSPILVSDGEISIGRAAPEFPILGQSGDVSRRADVFLRTPLGDGYLATLGYTSHLTINDSNGNPGLFQMDPLNRVYQVYGDSSTQYQAAQSNAHAYGRLENGQSYLLFGDLRMTSVPVNGAPTNGASAFTQQQGNPQQISPGVGDYNRNVVGAALHLEDAHHDFITVQGARPNTAFARDVFPGSTFGLIQLSHINILPGSESGVVETRDVHNPEIVLSREQLVRSVDYSIDPYTGAVFFLRTLNAYDQALNLNQVVFTYEYQNTGGTSSVYGIRAQVRADSIGFKLGMGVTEQRDPVIGDYFLGDVTLQQRLPMAGRLSVEVPVSHGTALSAGLTNGTLTDVNGTAIRADIDQPFGYLSGRFRGSFSKTDAEFFNPFGETVIPGAQTSRGTIELKPVKKSTIKFGFTDERNKTSLVHDQRQSGSIEWKQVLAEKLNLTAGFDARDYQNALTASQIKSNELAAGLEWKPFRKFTASVRREENLTAMDPTYPNETLLSARYQATETVRLFATERLASAPITPIGDLSTTGFAALAGKNETSIGIEDKWSKYTSIQSKYLVENGINGTDTFAVIGLVNRIPVQEHFSLDLGMERGELLTGKDRSFDSGSVGFSWLPKKNFRASTRYEIRDLGGLGQIITTGVAGRLSDGLTVLGRYQYSEAAFQPGTGAVDVLNPLAANSTLSQQTSANQGTAALAWRPWKTDREGILFSYTLRDATLNGVATASTEPQHDSVGMLSTDGYYQATRTLELYGKFALSDRTYNYAGSSPVSTFTYLWQARAQQKVSRRFDIALEGRTIYQPDTSLNQWTVATEVGFWAVKDLRLGVGYSFRSADEVAADFLTNPVKQGVYFVLTSKLSKMFTLFDAPTCTCAAQPAPLPPPPAPRPVANLQISAITGARDVCPSDDLRLHVVASGWLPDQTPAYQWYIDGAAVPGATGTSLMMPTARGSGTRSVTVSVTAGGLSKTSAPVSVLVKPILLPTIQFVVSPSVIAYGDKVPLSATGTASECTAPATITYTASEGSVTGNTFDSIGVAFDPSLTRAQTKVVHLTATATDRIGQKATASGDITITLTPRPRRMDDIVFTTDNARVNNCGKRLLLEELTPMLRNDPNARVVLIGHRDTGEKPGQGKNGVPVDEQRVLNAAAVLSAGTGICPQLDLSRILATWVGTEQASNTRPALCGASTGVKEKAGQAVKESDARAQFRRVEIWFVPGGAEMPPGITDLKPVPEKETKALACPK